MFKIGNLVRVFLSQDLSKSFIAKVVGFDYDREVVFVDTDEKTYEVDFASVEGI